MTLVLFLIRNVYLNNFTKSDETERLHFHCIVILNKEHLYKFGIRNRTLLQGLSIGWASKLNFEDKNP